MASRDADKQLNVMVANTVSSSDATDAGPAKAIAAAIGASTQNSTTPTTTDIAALIASFKHQQISFNQLIEQNRLLTEQNRLLMATLTNRAPTAPAPPVPTATVPPAHTDVQTHTCTPEYFGDSSSDEYFSFSQMELELHKVAHRQSLSHNDSDESATKVDHTETSLSHNDSDDSATKAEDTDTEAEDVNSAMGAECLQRYTPDTDAVHDSYDDTQQDSNEIERSPTSDDDSAPDAESCASEASTGIPCEYDLAEQEYGYADPDEYDDYDDHTW